jgi:hypothetical protein
MRQEVVRNEARARSVNMTIAMNALAMCEEALRDNQMQVIFCPGHRDVEQTPLFLDLSRGSHAEIGGNASVDNVEHKNRLPFLTFS